MRKIGFKNFRSLANSGMIDLKPINILVGQNNSGKSTFLRSFPLLRQSVESKIIGPILWYGDYVDFGSFNDSLFTFSTNNKISLLFDFQLDVRSLSLARSLIISGQYTRIFRIYPSRDVNVKLQIDIGKGSKGNSLTEGFQIEFEDITIRISTLANKITSIQINNLDYSDYLEKALIDPRSQGFLQEIINNRSFKEDILTRIVHEVKKNNHPRTSEQTIYEIISYFLLGSSESILKQMQDIGLTETWKKKVASWTINSNDFIRLRDYLFIFQLDTLITSINEYLEQFSRNIRYIAPIRATAERYYRWQNLSVDEIDYRGQNLAMFLNNLTTNEKNEFIKWTNSLLGIGFTTSESSGQISIQVMENKYEVPRNLTDTGFGFSQMLPIITQLWSLVNQRRSRIYRYTSKMALNLTIPITFAIEQPELHLHPAMQAKFVDALIDTINHGRKKDIDIRLIIETHSETIINKLGHLVYKKRLPPKDINIICFNKNKEKQTDIHIAKFNKDGYLTDWPIGFFEPEID